jgi:Amt family ammonium transporter
MSKLAARIGALTCGATALIASAAPALALAAAAPPKIDAADTAWMIAATGLVLMMSIPGLALFYAGMVRKKNILATMAQTLTAVAGGSLLWMVIGYSLAFTGDGPAIGTYERMFLHGMGMDSISPLAKTIPESVFMIYQLTFAVITVALVAGSVADRMRFSAFVWFALAWLLVVYVPIAHWVWGGGFLGTLGLLDFAGGTVVHLNAGVAGLVAAYVLGPRRGYGTENLAPYDLALAVIGTGLLWVGWFGFNGGSALGANSRAGFAVVATHLSACAGVMTWMLLEWWDRGKPSVLGMISGAVAGLGTITPASGYTTTRLTCSACTASAAPPARCSPACSRLPRSAAPLDCWRATATSSWCRSTASSRRCCGRASSPTWFSR